MQAVISLGSNIGDSIATVKNAIQTIDSKDGIKVIKQSSLYRTKPVGYLDQDDFINAVIEVETSLSADDLYKVIASIEELFGRVRSFKNAPRTLDLDLILFGNQIINSQILTVPHPRAHERAFVMIPLCEIEPDYVFETLHLSAQQILAQLPQEDCLGVVKI